MSNYMFKEIKICYFGLGNKIRLFIMKVIISLLIASSTLLLSGQTVNQLKVNSADGSNNNNIKLITDRQVNYIKRIYSDKIEAPRELINGKEYEPYYTRSKIKPLLFPERIRTASVITRTRRYNDLILQYDTFLDEVVYTDTSRNFNYRYPQIALNKNIIEGFILYFQDDSMTFKYIRYPESSESNLNEGFYEVVYTGQSRFYIKHESTFYVREALDNYKYSPKNYIKIGTTFQKIKSLKRLLPMLGEKADNVREYMHSSYIKARKAKKADIIKVLKYYDSL